MSEDAGLNVYQIAYVCGGPARVAMVALVGLYEDGQIKIARARRRVTVLERDHDDPVRAAAVASIPEAGRTLGSLLSAIAASGEVTEIGRALRERGLLPRSRLALWSSSRGRTTRSLRRRIVAGLPAEADMPRRVATMGPAGITDPELRRLFETPDPDLSVSAVRVPGTRGGTEGYNAPQRGDGYGEGGGASGW
jgi:uncharacterized protein (TIGR04222 family)